MDARTGGSHSSSNSRFSSGMGVNRSAGVTGSSASSAWCGRSALYWATNPSTAVCAAVSDSNGSWSSSSSRRKVRWNLSIFPVVVGDAGWVSRCVIALWRQILSNNTSPPLPKRSVNCLPLSVKISSGTPYRRSAAANARHTARPVADSTTEAITQNREWSSTPVTTFASRNAPVTGSTSITPPTMSSCHNCIGLGRSHRWYDSRRRFRFRGITRPCRTRIRLIVRVAGIVQSTGGFLSSSIRIRFAPQRGC